MSSNPMIGSPTRSGAVKRTVSFPAAGASDRAEAGYGSTPDAPSAPEWTDASRVRVAGRLLLTIAVFGILGSLLPFFAVGWANKLGTPSISRTGASVSGLQSLQSMPAVSALGQAPGEGDANLLGTPLKPCSSSDQASTGWTRSGSCAWSPDDSGYHEVCVTMDDEFLASSAAHDGNDLSGVVAHGERWCMCAWAWASAVERDPERTEGLRLECEESNAKLRAVYQSFIDRGEGMTGPTGVAYGPTRALEAVNRLCPAPAPAGAGLGDARRARMEANARATLGVPY